MATTFKPHPNNVSTTLAANHVSGSGQLIVASGTGAAFGSVFPMLVTVAQAVNVGTTAEVNAIFQVTSRSGDTLTVSGAAEGTTDQNFAIGDRVECRWTSSLATAIETAVNGVENSSGITAGVIGTARLGAGAASNCNWLRGDSAWAPIFTYTDKSGGGSVGVNQTLCAINAASGAVTLTLPVINGAPQIAGLEFLFVRLDSSANVITIQRAGTDVIYPGGVASTTIPTGLGKYIRFMSMGAIGWLIVGTN